jgi:hypothetical protein
VPVDDQSHSSPDGLHGRIMLWCRRLSCIQIIFMPMRYQPLLRRKSWFHWIRFSCVVVTAAFECSKCTSASEIHACFLLGITNHIHPGVSSPGRMHTASTCITVLATLASQDYPCIPLRQQLAHCGISLLRASVGGSTIIFRISYVYWYQ